MSDEAPSEDAAKTADWDSGWQEIHGKAPILCGYCNGDGWYADHAPVCYDAGDCVGCGGVQVECAFCDARKENGRRP